MKPVELRWNKLCELMMGETPRQHRNAIKTWSESGGGDQASGRDPFPLSVANSGKVNFVKQKSAALNQAGSQHETSVSSSVRKSEFNVPRPLFYVRGKFNLSLFLPPSSLRNASLSILARSGPSCSLSRHGICYSSFS